MIKGWYIPAQGIVRISGKDSRDFLNRMLSCNVAKLAVGQVIPGTLLNALGRLIAPLWCWGIAEDNFLLQTPTDCLETLAGRLDAYVFSEDVQIEICPGRLWQIVGMSELVAGQIVSQAEGYLATQQSNGMFWSPTDQDLAIYWEELGYLALSTEQVEAQRILQGYPAWGHELTEELVPLGLGWDQALDHNKGCYTGQEVISRLTFVGHPQNQLVGVRLKELLSNLPLDLQKEGTSIGSLTSCVTSLNDKIIGLARIRWQRAIPGDTVQIEFEGTMVEATICVLPFMA